MAHSEIIKKTGKFISNLFGEKISGEMLYHNFAHTSNVVENSRRIGKKSDLCDEDLEIITLAAWFHDAGYTETYKGHENKSIEIAENFLKGHGYSEEKIKKIVGCIDASKMPQNPHNLLEQILCDADLFHLGQEDFFDYSELLKTEWENLNIKKATELEWLKINIDFLSTHKYYTTYAREKFAPRQMVNLIKAQKLYKKKIAEIEEEEKRDVKMAFEKQKLELEKQKLELKKNDDTIEVEKEKLLMKKEASKIAERGIETMFRNSIRTHVEFSAMADKKAQIMITINGVIISFLISSILVSSQYKLSEFPYIVISSLFLVFVCLVSVVYAVLATRPKVTSGIVSQEDIRAKKANLLFFGN